MRSKNFIFLILSFICITGIAQEPAWKSYDWGEPPVAPDSVSDEKVILQNTEIIEFIFEGDYFYEYQVSRMTELINSDEQIQMNNKKYVPYGNGSELVEAKIRLVKPDGEIITLDDSKILTAVDEETQQNYKYFALEGLEPGSIIDYYYVIKKYPHYNGAIQYIQDEYPVRDYDFELYCPSHLEFAFKVYNDTNHVQYDTTLSEKNHWTLRLRNFDGLKYEESSPYYTLVKQVVYKLDKNQANGSGDLSSLGSTSTSVYQNLFTELDKQDQKALASLMNKIKLAKDATTDEKVRQIETYVKSNISLVGEGNPDYQKIASVIKLKSASEIGMIRLLTRLLEMADVDFQIVLTSDRRNRIFDEEFESTHYLAEYLLYFPETKKYLMPTSYEYRYGIVPWQYMNNKGLFIKETRLGDYRTGIGKVRFIEPLSYEVSAHNTFVDAVIPPDFGQVDLEMTLENHGYYAAEIQSYYELFDEEAKEDIMKEIFRDFFSESEILEWSAENGEARWVGVKPFIQKYHGLTGELINQAGDQYLFKVGKLIGGQVELYSEEERTLKLDDRYKRSFHRELNIEIPEGYVIRNPGDLVMDVNYTVDGEKILSFNSDYSLEGQMLSIVIDEYYNQIIYDTDAYESYRKVVNAAADFEKVVLILEKE